MIVCNTKNSPPSDDATSTTQKTHKTNKSRINRADEKSENTKSIAANFPRNLCYLIFFPRLNHMICFIYIGSPVIHSLRG